MEQVIARPVGNRSGVLHRQGFTLIELLIAITIIGVLAGLLIPALSGAKQSTQKMQVRNEIASLEASLTQFKNDFGMFPPSDITLWEAEGDGTPMQPGWKTDARSKALIKQLWPQFDFTLTSRDLDGDGTPGETGTAGAIQLARGDALVFFLGGMTQKSGTKYTMVGFSKDPTNPFAQPTPGTQANRQGPYFEFIPDRLRDLTSNNFPEYFDPIPNQGFPYLYLSAYDGQGYRTAAVTATPPGEFDDAAALPAARTSLKVPYRQTGTTAWNAKTYQIISPGFGGTSASNVAEAYGDGGIYDPAKLDDPTDGLIGTRIHERDNITNFYNSTLAPN